MLRKHLYIVAAVIWGIPGVIISAKGIMAYITQSQESLLWLLLITIVTGSAFFLIFRIIVAKYCNRIASLPEKVTIFQTFPMRGWILLIFMMGLGITLRYIPDIPSAFTAAFYSGLGPMLLLSSARFVHCRVKK